MPLSTQLYKWVPTNCWGNLTNCGGLTCNGPASRPGGVKILLAASCYRTWISSGSFESVSSTASDILLLKPPELLVFWIDLWSSNSQKYIMNHCIQCKNNLFFSLMFALLLQEWALCNVQCAFVISGPNGAHFSGSVETESLRAPPKKELRLASLTRSLHMDAPDGMSFKSAAGSVSITSLKDVTIKSMNGKVWRFHSFKDYTSLVNDYITWSIFCWLGKVPLAVYWYFLRQRADQWLEWQLYYLDMAVNLLLSTSGYYK